MEILLSINLAIVEKSLYVCQIPENKTPANNSNAILREGIGLRFISTFPLVIN